MAAAAVRSAAEPLAARLAAGLQEEQWERQVSMTRGIMGRPDGGTQHLWLVTCPISPRERAIKLCYDAGTGNLIQASITSGMTPRKASGKETLTAEEAIGAAGRWLTKLGLSGLAQTQPSADVPSMPFPPEQLPGGPWRVWLWGQETPDGRALTVEVRINGSTGDMIAATVVERCAVSRFFLPRPAQRSSVSR